MKKTTYHKLTKLIERIINEENSPNVMKLEKLKSMILQKCPEMEFKGYENEIGTFDQEPGPDPYRIAFKMKGSTSSRGHTIAFHKSLTTGYVYSPLLRTWSTSFECRDSMGCLQIAKKFCEMVKNGKKINTNKEMLRLLGANN